MRSAHGVQPRDAQHLRCQGYTERAVLLKAPICAHVPSHRALMRATVAPDLLSPSTKY
jgi:hypothetical protein